MVSRFLACVITTNLWLGLLCLAAHVADKSVDDIAVRWCVLCFAICVSSFLIEWGLCTLETSFQRGAK